MSATACAAAQPLVDLSIVDRDTGSSLTTYRHHDRSYVAGEPGHRYALHLYNHTAERVMVVLSVDGVNAVTGQTAAANQAGYVLGPWQSADIAGWRKSDDDIAQFVFTSLGDSYAARTGRPDNVGVVGMAVFRERPQQPVYVPPPPMTPYPTDEQRYDASDRATGAPRNSAAAPAPAMSANAQAAREAAPAAKAYGDVGGAVAQELGTGHGAREYSPISRTSFERLSSTPQQVTQIWYDSPQQLAARGIIPRWYPRPAQPSPQAFPVGYVPDPPPQW
ncbi:MAG: hypothetical protein JSR26_10830 [Proteobacteria bacterium]|nr:hypothetical protein [Pseudomonadota bacterium]